MQQDENAVVTNGFFHSQPLFTMAPKPKPFDNTCREALEEVALTTSNLPPAAQGTKKKALERGEKAYRAWKQRQAERARPTTGTTTTALAGPPAPTAAPVVAPPHSAPYTTWQAPQPSTEICVDVGSAPCSPKRPSGPAAALANMASATAAAMPMASQLFSRLGQLACPTPAQGPQVDAWGSTPHGVGAATGDAVVTEPSSSQETWQWSMRLPLWPFTFTLGVALADEEDPAPNTNTPSSPLLMPTTDNTNLAWQPTVSATPTRQQTIPTESPPALAASSNPLFEHSTTPPVAIMDAPGDKASVVCCGDSVEDEGILLHMEAAHTPGVAAQHVEETNEEAMPGTPTDPEQRIEAMDPDMACLTAGPTKQQQRAFQDAHGHAPHGWRLNEDTLRWEPVILTDETHKELEQQLQVTEVVKERNRLKKQLMELQAKIAALEAASGNPPSPTDPMQPANATVSQAAAAKIALANVLVNEPKLTRTLTDIPASGDTVPDVVQQPVNMPPLSPALSSGDLSSLAASPLGVVAPEDAPTAPHSVQGKAGPAKKLSFFENSLFSQPLAMLLGTGTEEEDTAPETATGEISCATTPLGIDAAAAQWQEAHATAHTTAAAAETGHSVDLGEALRQVGVRGSGSPVGVKTMHGAHDAHGAQTQAPAEDDWDEDWGLHSGGITPSQCV